MDSELKEVPTSQLVKELKKRLGVNTVEVPPYAKVNLSVEGAAIVLVVID